MLGNDGVAQKQGTLIRINASPIPQNCAAIENGYTVAVHASSTS